MIVLDASAAVDWLEGRSDSDVAVRVSRRMTTADSIHVPHLWLVEVTQALRRHVAAGLVSPDRGLRTLRVAERLPAVRHGHESLVERVWALRENLTAYDAIYVALAEVLDATLVTTDARLARSPGHAATIDLVD